MFVVEWVMPRKGSASLVYFVLGFRILLSFNELLYLFKKKKKKRFFFFSSLITRWFEFGNVLALLGWLVLKGLGELLLFLGFK
jgi:hypothetical protein